MGPEEERILWVVENSGAVVGVNPTLCPGFSDVVPRHPLLSGVLARGKEVYLAWWGRKWLAGCPGVNALGTVAIQRPENSHILKL